MTEKHTFSDKIETVCVVYPLVNSVGNRELPWHQLMTSSRILMAYLSKYSHCTTVPLSPLYPGLPYYRCPVCLPLALSSSPRPLFYPLALGLVFPSMPYRQYFPIMVNVTFTLKSVTNLKVGLLYL